VRRHALSQVGDDVGSQSIGPTIVQLPPIPGFSAVTPWGAVSVQPSAQQQPTEPPKGEPSAKLLSWTNLVGGVLAAAVAAGTLYFMFRQKKAA